MIPIAPSPAPVKRHEPQPVYRGSAAALRKWLQQGGF